jgi:hypothetical protein
MQLIYIIDSHLFKRDQKLSDHLIRTNISLLLNFAIVKEML